MRPRDAWGLRAELEILSAAAEPGGLLLSDPGTLWLLEQLEKLEAGSPTVEPTSALALAGRASDRKAAPTYLRLLP